MVTTQNYDIHDRMFSFIVNVINYINKIPKTFTNQVFIQQITRSVTSMGANDQEADGALTRRDFIHGFTLVRKEGKETVFWLKLIIQFNTKFKDEGEVLIKEGNEIIAIISRIILNSSNKTQKI